MSRMRDQTDKVLIKSIKLLVGARTWDAPQGICLELSLCPNNPMSSLKVFIYLQPNYTCRMASGAQQPSRKAIRFDRTRNNKQFCVPHHSTCKVYVIKTNSELVQKCQLPSGVKIAQKLIYPVIMGPGQFRIGETPDKNNFTGFFGNLRV